MADNLKWKECTPPSLRQMQCHSCDLNLLLHAMNGGCKKTSIEIIFNLLHKRSFNAAGEIQVQLYTEKTIEGAIIQTIQTFVHHHHSLGTKQKESQEVLDTISCATFFGGSENDMWDTSVSQLLGLGCQPIAKEKERVEELKLKEEKSTYHHASRERRSDSIWLLVPELVMDFCHSDEASCLDSNISYISVKEPDGTKRRHKLQYWEGKLNKQGIYKSFLEWEGYATC
eukprot:8488085-Ditylum_brightwellii.AAC.1